YDLGILLQVEHVMTPPALCRYLATLEDQALGFGLEGPFFQPVRSLVQQLAGRLDRAVEESDELLLHEGHVPVLALRQRAHQPVEVGILAAGAARRSKQRDRTQQQQTLSHRARNRRS